MVCNICIVRMITFLEDDPLSRQRIQPYNKLIKQQLQRVLSQWIIKMLLNLRRTSNSVTVKRYLPPPKRVPFAAPNVENSTDRGIRTAAPPRTRSPHVYKQTYIQYWHVNERLCTRWITVYTCLLACEFYYDPNPINQKQGFRYQKRRFYFAMPKNPYILSKGLSSLYFDGPITWESFVWVLIHSLLISGWYRNFLSHISGPFCSASIKLFKTRKQSYITESTGQLYHCKNLTNMQWCLHTTATAGELRSSNDVIAVR